MPSTITHAYFALDVYEHLDNKTKKRIANNLEHLKTFSQAADILFFYTNINKRITKKVKNLGNYIHNNKSKDFFIYYIKYIKENKLENDADVITFLYGYITHYVLDSTIHPYVFYKTGMFDKKRPLTYKYNALHRDMEAYIDAYMIYTKSGMKPKNFKVHNFCFNVKSFSKSLEDTINDVFNTVYHENNIANVYLKSIKQMKWFFYIFKYDPYGFKKLKYHFFNKFLPPTALKYNGISYYIHQKEKLYYLNLEKNKWNHPIDENEIYNFSFIELYRISIEKTIKIIDQVNEVLYNKKDISMLDDVFLNLSYITGKHWEEKQKLQYFEF